MLFLSSLALFLSVAADPSGFGVLITDNLLQVGTRVMEPIVVAKLQSTAIPDQDFDSSGVHVEVQNIKITGITCNNCVTCIVKGTQYILTVTGVTLSATAYVHLKKSFVSTHVDVDATASGFAGTLVVNIGEQDGTFFLTPVMSNFAIGNLDLSFHGGISWLLDLVKHPIEDTLSKSLVSNLDSELSKAVSDNANTFLQQHKLVGLPSSSNDKINLATTPSAPPIGTVTSLTLYATGTTTPGPQCAPGKPLPVPPPSPIGGLPGTHDIEIAASSSGILQAIQVYLECVPFNKLFNYDKLSGLPIGAFNTTTMKAFAPGLANPPWADHWMALGVTSDLTLTAPRLSLAPNNTIATVGLAFTFYVVNGQTNTAAFSVGCPASVSVSPAVSVTSSGSLLITGKVNTITCSIALLSTQVGDVMISSMSYLVTAAIQMYVIPELNSQLATGIPVSLPLTPVKLTAAEVILRDGSALVGASLAPGWQQLWQ